ncbi:MAG: LptF/LptG family permease, partial [Planctomycetota bacterium]
ARSPKAGATKPARARTGRARPAAATSDEQRARYVSDSSPFSNDEEFGHPSGPYRWWLGERAPWTLWKYSSLEVLRVTILCILAVSLLYAALAAFQAVRGGIQLAYIWPFLVRTVGYPLYFSIPLSLLFGVTLVFGRMSSEFEIAAMRSHGVSPWQLFAPVIALGLVAAVAGHAVNGNVVPEVRYEKRNLQQYVIDQLENLGSGRNRSIPLPNGGGNLLVGAYKGKELWKVEVDLDRELQSKFVPEIRGQLPRRLPETITLLARMGRLEIPPEKHGVVIHLRGVEILVPEKARSEIFYQRFSITETLSIPLSFEKKPRTVKDLTNNALSDRIAQLETKLTVHPDAEPELRQLQAARHESNRRFAVSLSSLTLPFVGACFCFLFVASNRLMPFFVGNLVALGLFYPLLMVGSSLSERGVPSGLAHAIPNLALLVLGGILARKVMTQ